MWYWFLTFIASFVAWIQLDSFRFAVYIFPLFNFMALHNFGMHCCTYLIIILFIFIQRLFVFDDSVFQLIQFALKENERTKNISSIQIRLSIFHKWKKKGKKKKSRNDNIRIVRILPMPMFILFTLRLCLHYFIFIWCVCVCAVVSLIIWDCVWIFRIAYHTIESFPDIHSHHTTLNSIVRAQSTRWYMNGCEWMNEWMN